MLAMFELFTIHLKQDISIYCQEKYGLVQVAFDSLVPLDENAASVQFAVNDPAGGFITRHYGTATYTGGRLRLKTKTI
jgi:hypothetical protein